MYFKSSHSFPPKQPNGLCTIGRHLPHTIPPHKQRLHHNNISNFNRHPHTFIQLWNLRGLLSVPPGYIALSFSLPWSSWHLTNLLSTNKLYTMSESRPRWLRAGLNKSVRVPLVKYCTHQFNFNPIKGK